MFCFQSVFNNPFIQKSLCFLFDYKLNISVCPLKVPKKKQINNRTWAKKDGQEQKRESGENVTLRGPQCWNGLSEMSHLTQTSHLTHLTHMTQHDPYDPCDEYFSRREPLLLRQFMTSVVGFHTEDKPKLQPCFSHL